MSLSPYKADAAHLSLLEVEDHALELLFLSPVFFFGTFMPLYLKRMRNMTPERPKTIGQSVFMYRMTKMNCKVLVLATDSLQNSTKAGFKEGSG